ncbi:MAG: hypothetical protein AAGE01_21170 [Pseudomonadota bacterium]
MAREQSDPQRICPDLNSQCASEDSMAELHSDKPAASAKAEQADAPLPPPSSQDIPDEPRRAFKQAEQASELQDELFHIPVEPPPPKDAPLARHKESLRTLADAFAQEQGELAQNKAIAAVEGTEGINASNAQSPEKQ